MNFLQHRPSRSPNHPQGLLAEQSVEPSNNGSRPKRSAISPWILSISLTLVMSLAPSMLLAGDSDRQTEGKKSASSEQLVIFTQPAAGSAISRAFDSQHLAALEQTASELGVSVTVLDASDGAPDEVRITPLLIHQSARGRSFFQGRYTDPGKLKNFVRTSRAVPAASDPQIKKHVAVLQQGRSRVYSPLKVTDLTGSRPTHFDDERFRRQAEEAILEGFNRFKSIDEITLGPADRAFYMDFYPHRSDDGRLFIGLGLFSQFNCIDPVFTQFETPISGSFDELDAVFAQAARMLEKEVANQVASSELGDGFDPVPGKNALVSWEALGLKLPERSAGANGDTRFGSVADLPRRWKIAPPQDNAPRLVFRFPSPLERYSGEVLELSGSLQLAEHNDPTESGSLQGAEGWIRAETSSVTMGEPSLDNAIHQKMIHAAKFPGSRFDLKEVSPETESLAFGRSARLQANGIFRLMGADLPISIRGDIEPVIGDDGMPRLHVRAAFDIRLSAPFGIAGPDGPEPARDTLKFYLNFLMEADSEDAGLKAASEPSRPRTSR